jgi:hypothetical protein
VRELPDLALVQRPRTVGVELVEQRPDAAAAALGGRGLAVRREDAALVGQVHLGFGRIVASEKEAPIQVVNLL